MARILNARSIVVWLLVCAGVGLVLVSPAAEAAPSFQGGTISFDDPLPSGGTLDATVPEAVYTFKCFEDMTASVLVETTSGDLLVDFDVVDAAGAPLATGAVVSENPNTTVAEAFQPPADGSCQVRLTRSGSTTGTYTIRLLRGFARLAKQDSFDNDGSDLSLTWASSTGDDMIVDVTNSALSISILTDNLFGWVEPDENPGYSDLFMQVNMSVEGTPSYFQYGLLFRLDPEADTFYALNFSSEGDWALLYLTPDGWEVVSEWTFNEVIDGANLNPRIGMWVQGQQMRVYFYDELVAEMDDIGTLAESGSVAVFAATRRDQTDTINLTYDNLYITTPFGGAAAKPPSGGSIGDMFGGDDDVDDQQQPSATPRPQPTATPRPQPTATPRPQPTATPRSSGDRLESWQTNSPSEIVGELRGLGLVPSGGSVNFTLPESFGDTISSGFNYYPLGRGREFRNFVLKFDTRLAQTGPESGCGMHFRNNNQGTTIAVVTEDGSAYMGNYDSSGNLHPDSDFVSSSAINAGQGASNQVIIVATESGVRMYVNGQLLINGGFPAQSGTIALEVYVAEDDLGRTEQTRCELSDIWLWEY